MPTERVEAAAVALKKSGDVRSAMAEAGYGNRFIDGNADTFPDFLHAHGLLTDKQYEKFTPTARPASTGGGSQALDEAQARIAELEAALAAATSGDGGQGGDS